MGLVDGNYAEFLFRIPICQSFACWLEALLLLKLSLPSWIYSQLSGQPFFPLFFTPLIFSLAWHLFTSCEGPQIGFSFTSTSTSTSTAILVVILTIWIWKIKLELNFILTSSVSGDKLEMVQAKQSLSGNPFELHFLLLLLALDSAWIDDLVVVVAATVDYPSLEVGTSLSISTLISFLLISATRVDLVN